MGLFDNITNWVDKKIDEGKEKYQMVQQQRAEEQEIINRKKDYVKFLLAQPEINDTLLERYVSDRMNPPSINVSSEEHYKIEYLNYLWKINNDMLPQLDWSNVGIIPKKGEMLHYLDRAVLREMKSKTTRINYGGLTGSIKIVKGVRYRWGSMNVDTQKTNYIDNVANGIFFISNKRVGFVSQTKNFSLPIPKIMSVTLEPSIGLLLFKENKDKPYMMALNSYETPCVLLSHLVSE